jgi:hypothetical protein
VKTDAQHFRNASGQSQRDCVLQRCPGGALIQDTPERSGPFSLSPGERAAFIGLSASFFFKVEDARLHGIQVFLLATFIGLVIFMIFALDRPFRGDLGLRPDAYQLMFDQLMK